MSNPKFDLLGRLVSLLVTVSQWWGALVDLAEKLNSADGETWEDELRKFLRKEPTWVRRWREKDGIIRLEVISDGTTGPEWIKRLEEKGFKLSKLAKGVLNSSDFKPTKDVAYRIAILKGMLFIDSDRTTSKIRTEANRRNWQKPNPEVACLIRELLSDEELEAMGLWRIVVFHESIKYSGGGPVLLYVYRGDGGRWLDACCGRPVGHWFSDLGFAFVSPQVSSN